MFSIAGDKICCLKSFIIVCHFKRHVWHHYDRIHVLLVIISCPSGHYILRLYPSGHYTLRLYPSVRIPYGYTLLSVYPTLPYKFLFVRMPYVNMPVVPYDLTPHVRLLCCRGLVLHSSRIKTSPRVRVRKQGCDQWNKDLLTLCVATQRFKGNSTITIDGPCTYKMSREIN